MMNKNEAVLKLARGTLISIAHAEDLYDSFFEKPVVPQYVADWYEEHKDRLDYYLWEYLVEWNYQKPCIFKDWMARDSMAEPVITLINMHQFGYEVEKEKRYTVRFNNFKAIESYLKQDLVKQKYYLGDKSTSRSIVLTHTRKELEDAGFGWVFDCEGIEIEEVE